MAVPLESEIATIRRFDRRHVQIRVEFDQDGLCHLGGNKIDLSTSLNGLIVGAQDDLDVIVRGPKGKCVRSLGPGRGGAAQNYRQNEGQWIQLRQTGPLTESRIADQVRLC